MKSSLMVLEDDMPWLLPDQKKAYQLLHPNFPDHLGEYMRRLSLRGGRGEGRKRGERGREKEEGRKREERGRKERGREERGREERGRG
jgi:hypothetical protein